MQMSINKQNLVFRQLTAQDQNPYELLLLADPSIEIIEKYLKTSKVFVVEQNEMIIGTIVFQPLVNNLSEIKNVAVLPEFQGQGIGEYLIESVIQIARQMNFKTIQIGTANSSVGQLYLYQKLGFDISEIRKDFFIRNYKESIYENGIQVKHMIMLMQTL